MNKRDDNQKERILKYIERHGKIDRLSAFRDCGIFELSARIVELEHAGHVFRKKGKQGVSRFGHSFHYVEYSLA
jgi:hypothetical protein